MGPEPARPAHIQPGAARLCTAHSSSLGASISRREIVRRPGPLRNRRSHVRSPRQLGRTRTDAPHWSSSLRPKRHRPPYLSGQRASLNSRALRLDACPRIRMAVAWPASGLHASYPPAKQSCIRSRTSPPTHPAASHSPFPAPARQSIICGSGLRRGGWGCAHFFSSSLPPLRPPIPTPLACGEVLEW